MRQSLIPNSPNQREIVADNIAKGYVNGDEMVLGPAYSEFKNQIQKGEVATVTPADIKEHYGGKFFTREQKSAFEKGLDDLLKKGEDAATGWTEDEAAFYEKAVSDLERIERVAVPIQKGVDSPVVYAEIFVLRKELAAAE